MTTLTRVFDLLTHYRNQYGQQDVVAGRKEGGWVSYRTDEWIDAIDAWTIGLLDLGIKRGDKIAIMSANRPEWNIADFAAQQIGAALVPLYPTLSEHDLSYILENAEVQLILVGEKELYEKVEKTARELQLQADIYTFDPVEGQKNWQDIRARKKEKAIDLQVYRDAVQGDDLLTLIYTSGTTGNPKGVCLTHKNLLSNFTDCAHLLPPTYKKAVSFLPLSHIFERMVIYLYLYRGVTIYYTENMDTMIRDLNEIGPHGFTTVPRVLEKVYDRIVELGRELKGVKRFFFFWALHVGGKFKEADRQSFWYRLGLTLSRRLVFQKWQEALGGNIVCLISGGAALQERLARLFWAAGIPVLEGYGLTETSPVIAVNSLLPGGLRFGSVGKVLSSIDVKIADDGEILCKGPNLTSGYYRNEEASKEAFDEEGYFKTGDIGVLTVDRFLYITDRKKEMFKTAGGKYIAPQIIENKLMASSFIAQVMVLGEGKRFPAALIVPDREVLQKWGDRKKKIFRNEGAWTQDPQVLAQYQDVIDRTNTELGHWEQIKKFVLIPHEWTVSGGELTPKLSLKRKVILERYRDIISAIYQEQGEASSSPKASL